MFLRNKKFLYYRNKRATPALSQTDCTAPSSLVQSPNTRQNTTFTGSSASRDTSCDDSTVTELEDLELASIAVSISPDTFSPPRCTSPKVSPRRSSPRRSSPRRSSPRKSSPRRSSPRRSSPRRSCSPFKSPRSPRLSPATQSNFTTLSPRIEGVTFTYKSSDDSEHDDSGRDLFLTPRSEFESN